MGKSMLLYDVSTHTTPPTPHCLSPHPYLPAWVKDMMGPILDVVHLGCKTVLGNNFKGCVRRAFRAEDAQTPLTTESVFPAARQLFNDQVKNLSFFFDLAEMQDVVDFSPGGNLFPMENN